MAVSHATPHVLIVASAKCRALVSKHSAINQVIKQPLLERNQSRLLRPEEIRLGLPNTLASPRVAVEGVVGHGHVFRGVAQLIGQRVGVNAAPLVIDEALRGVCFAARRVVCLVQSVYGTFWCRKSRSVDLSHICPVFCRWHSII